MHMGVELNSTEPAKAVLPLWIMAAVMLIIVPAALSLTFSEIMRKLGWIKQGDMLLEI